MFSYEEMIDISKKYRFKLDFNTKQFHVINTSTGEKLTDSEETNKIKGLLYAHQTMMFYKNDLPKSMSEEQKTQLLIDEFKKLQESLVQIGLNGEYTIENLLKSGLIGYNPTQKFLSNAIPSFNPYTRRIR